MEQYGPYLTYAESEGYDQPLPKKKPKKTKTKKPRRKK